MDFAPAQNGLRCRKCSHPGPFPEGSMEKINEIKKRAPRSVSTVPSKPVENASQSMRELADKLKSMKGKSDGDVEFL
jgi:hypothetical protein